MRRLAVIALAGLCLAGIASASEGEGMASANVRMEDNASLQRGARLFFNYCSGCHSLQYLRYSRIAEDLKLDEKDVANNLIFTGARIGDKAISDMPAANAAAWFGKAPPDLSLEARAKGSDWIYNYLKSFYLDPSRPLGWNNTVFPNASMPNALWELQGLQVAVKHAAAEGHEAGVGKLEVKTPGRLDAVGYD
ncbi:MAG: cytochrome c1, partial [Rhodanobacteraceae bacterium]